MLSEFALLSLVCVTYVRRYNDRFFEKLQSGGKMKLGKFEKTI